MKAHIVWTRMVVAGCLVVAAWCRCRNSDPQWFSDEGQEESSAA
jgi:hypothetical protein